MILREWRGRVEHDRHGDYPMHFQTRVVPELRNFPGFVAADLIQRDLGDMIEFTVLTKWQSMDSIRAFSGDNPEKAVVEPGAIRALKEYDERVSHHEVIQSIVCDPL